MPRSVLTTFSENFISITNANKTRFLILLVSMLILIFSNADALLFNFTVICMTKNVNGTNVEIFNLNEKGMLYSSLAIGTLISCLVIMELIRKIGGRSVIKFGFPEYHRYPNNIFDYKRQKNYFKAFPNLSAL